MAASTQIRAWAGAGMLGCTSLLCACAGRAVSKVEASEKPVVAGAAASESGASMDVDDLRQYIDEIDPIAALNKPIRNDESLTSQAEEFAPTPAEPAVGSGPRVMEAPPRVVEPPSEAEVAALEAAVDVDAAPTGEVAGPAPAEELAEEGADVRLTRQLAELQGTISELRANGGAVSDEALELLAMGMLSNGASASELEAVKQKLPLGQQRAIETLEQLLSQLREESVASALDARRVSKLLTEHAEKLADARPLRITSAALCTSVESFGVYTKFPSNTFLQGRAQPVIVYVGLENFGQRAPAAGTKVGDQSAEAADSGLLITPSKEKDRKFADEKGSKTAKQGGWSVQSAKTGDFVVELTQSIAIHNDADDLVVWRAPDASIRDVSRERRQDYYLVQRVDLSPRLTLGKYNMKVTIRDVSTGATDETVIPIEVVADSSLVRGR